MNERFECNRRRAARADRPQPPLLARGREGELVFLRCHDCGYYLHPPIPVCPIDQSKDVRPEAVSGRATLASYTVNHHPWLPGFETPYVVAIVEFPEQTGLRLTTNLVNCPIEEIRIGMAVRVVFRHHEDRAGRRVGAALRARPRTAACR